jgi:hypothetical protein
MHRFWSSHKEKRVCVRLSMGGQPWPSSRSINGGMARSRERKGREGEGEQGGTARGAAMGRHGEGEGCRRGCRRHHGAAALLLLPACSLLCVKELDVRKERRKKERRKRK